MTTSVKITGLNPIGANITYTTLVPVVNMSGTPTTEKATAQVLGNLILSGAGGSYFPAAAQAVLAQTVVNAAQPNITSVGTLTSLNVTGNIVAGSFSGDGSLLTNVSAVNSYTNSNVANYLPTYTGTVGANRISSNSLSGSNIEINANGAVFTFGQGGALYWPAGPEQWVIEPNIDGEFEIKSTSNVVISTDTSNANSHFTFDSDGIFTAPSNVNLLGTRLNVGAGSANLTGLNAPTLVIATDSPTFVQGAIINTDGNGSSDLVAYGAGGNDTGGWADIGFAGNAFSDINYTITGAGDGYVFVQGYTNVGGGNLVLATGTQGTTKDIVFATGGFLANDEFARIDHANNVFHLTRAGSGIKFDDGSIQTTAATSGVSYDQSLNTTDSVSFANVNIPTGGMLMTDVIEDYAGTGLTLRGWTNTSADYVFNGKDSGGAAEIVLPSRTYIRNETGDGGGFIDIESYLSITNKVDDSFSQGSTYLDSYSYVIDIDQASTTGPRSTWRYDTDGLTFPDGEIQTTAYRRNENVKFQNSGSGVETLDCGVTNKYCTVFRFANVTNNITANFTNLGFESANSTLNRAMSVSVIIAQGATPYVCDAVQIEGVAQTVLWQGSATAPTGNANKTDIITFNIIRTGLGTTDYIVLGQLVSFG